MDNELLEFKCKPPCNQVICDYEPEGIHAFEVKCNQKGCKNINYRGSVITLDLEEFRCPGNNAKLSKKLNQPITCNKLLGRILEGTRIRRKCPRCGALVDSVDGII